MHLKIPDGLRYGLVNILEGRPSWLVSVLVRCAILIPMLLMAAPWRVIREVTFGSDEKSTDLKASLRTVLWIWNRSWFPVSFKMGTFFDIGWYLSEPGCQALQRRNFLNREPMKRQCDLAQLKLSSIKQGVDAHDQEQLVRVDREICSLVGDVLSEANRLTANQNLDQPDASFSKPRAVSTSGTNQRFNNDRTRSALLDFDDTCRTLSLPYFLVSGTFLGVVRDQAFIGHDHDIDVGVFEEDLSESLISALLRTGNFTITLTDTICLRKVDDNSVRYSFMAKPAIIRLAHKTGISIDMFTHFHDGYQVWHGSSVHRWNNEAFELRDYEFLGRQFKGAKDYDLYLTENYGPDWRIPKAEFNVNLDTPNLSFVGTANALAYFSWMVCNAVAEGQFLRVRKYFDILAALGVVDIADEHVRVK